MNRSPLLSDRTVTFSKDVINFCESVKITPITRPMVEQLVKSATSVGANYAEANNAASKTDFRSKIFIAKKEAAETEYWLRLFGTMPDYTERCRELWQECHYILMTLQKIINSLRDKSMPNGKQPMVNAR